MIHGTGRLKSFVVGAAIALAGLLSACGGGGGGSAPPPDTPLALMVDSMGRQLPEAEFGHGDALAAGADGIAFDGAPLANAPVTLTDGGGVTRTATTDAQGYYRLDIKSLRPPFIVKVKRADGSEWFSAATAAPVIRGFVPININGLTDKTLGYVADALNAGGGAASSVSAPMLASSIALLDQALAKLRAGLSVPLVNAGFDPGSYDPATASAITEKHAAFLRDLRFGRSAAGRTTVIGTVVGTTRPVSPAALAVDSAGALYVADVETSSIRKFSLAGVETTLVSFAGSAGSGTSAPYILGMAVDVDGNVFVADGGNNAILKVSPAGVVSTLAGGADRGFVDGTGSAAKFNYPNSVGVDRSGNVYVTDSNDAVRRITPAGVVTTIAGRTPQSPPSYIVVSTPRGIVLDAAGNAYFADTIQGKVVKITPGGTVSDFSRPSPAAGVTPVYLAVDAAGVVYAASYTRIARITATGVASSLAGSGERGAADGNGAAAGFSNISGIAIGADGSLLVADQGNQAVRRVTSAGDVTTVMGKKAPAYVDGTAASASFSDIGGVAVDAAGAIYLADSGNHAIRKIARSGAVTTLAGNGMRGAADGNGRAASFNGPIGIALDTAGNVHVADTGNNSVRKISPSGDVSTLAPGTFNRPTDIAVAADGTVYVSDGVADPYWGGQSVIRKLPATGGYSTLLANDSLPRPPDLMPTLLGPIAVDAGGTVLVKSYTPFFACDICFPGRDAIGSILAISPAGVVTQRTAAQSPPLSTRNSLAVDRDGNAYELRSRTLVRHSPAGVTTEIATDGMPPLFDSAGRIAVDANGNVVVVDHSSSAIRIVLP